MNFNFKGIVAPGAMVLQASLNSGPATVVAFTDELTGNPRVGGAITGVQVSLATLADRLAKGAPDLSDEGFVKAARAAVDAGLAPAFRLAVESAYKARGEIEAEWNALYTPKFPESSTRTCEPNCASMPIVSACLPDSTPQMPIRTLPVRSSKVVQQGPHFPLTVSIGCGALWHRANLPLRSSAIQRFRTPSDAARSSRGPA